METADFDIPPGKFRPDIQAIVKRMNSVSILSSVLGLAVASGVNLYASILVVGLGLRLHWITGLPGDLSILANPWILAAAGLMYFLEFFADKIPYVSVAWDTIHTVIRPLGGAALALASTAHLSPEMQTLAAIAGGTVALGSHSTKMGYRMIAHASPEPVSGSIFSVAEDVGVAGFVLLIYQHPATALGVVAALLLGIALILPFLLRILRLGFSGLKGRLVSLFAEPDPLPPNRIPCYSRRIKGAPFAQDGYLDLTQDIPRFEYRGWFATRTVQLQPATAQIPKTGILFNTLQTQTWSVFIPKDKGNAPLASSNLTANSSSTSSV